jgi:uncharacterized protein YbbC (DUF1343 family)
MVTLIKTYFKALLIVSCAVFAPLVVFAEVHAPIWLGIDMLEVAELEGLDRKHIGVIVNAGSVNREGKSTLDVLTQQLRLNIKGVCSADQLVLESAQSKYDIPGVWIQSDAIENLATLFQNLDVVIVDLQDNGLCSSEALKSLKLVLELAFTKKIEVIVLDRPNPLGGIKLAGCVSQKTGLDSKQSFPLPFLYGLTIAEVARLAKNVTGFLTVSDEDRHAGQLTIVPMKGWSRNKLWPSTGLQWISVGHESSNMPEDLPALMGKALLGMVPECLGFDFGQSSPFLYRVINYPTKSMIELKEALEASETLGLAFEPISFQDTKGFRKRAFYVTVNDWNKVQINEFVFNLLKLGNQWSAEKNQFVETDTEAVKKLNPTIGCTAFWSELMGKGDQADLTIHLQEWNQQLKEFQLLASRYCLYNY